MIIPALIFGLIYKVAHFEDWNRIEIICLLMFQLMISLMGAYLLTAHFAMAITTAIIFAVALAIIVGLIRSFMD
jgi:hypothetical protein